MAENLYNHLANLNLNQKTFYDLSVDTIGNIVEYLDFKSQTRLRKVSHGFRNIVDQVKPSIDRLALIYNFEGPIGPVIDLHASKNGSDCFHGTYVGKNCQEGVFDDLKFLLKNPRLQLNDFRCIECGLDPSDDFHRLIEVLDSLDHQLEITILSMTRMIKNAMIALMRAVKPGTLEKINVYGHLYKADDIDQLAKLNQWKQAKTMRIDVVLPDFSRHSHHFYHFEEFKIIVGLITLNDILNLKKVFSDNTNFKYCCIKTHRKPSNIEIKEAIGMVCDDPVESSFIGRCDIPNSKQILEFSLGLFFVVIKRTDNAI